MNELLFFIHVILISLFTVLALKISKESLVAAIVLFCVLANLFVVKQITLFGLHPTASDAFSVGAILGLNLLQEYFGKSIVKKTIWTCFFALLFYVIVTQIHLAYIPSMYDTSAMHFHFILRFMPRIAIASIAVTLIVQLIDRMLYGFLKNKFSGKQFFLRNIISLFVVQAIDTVLFSFAGLYGIVQNIWDVIIISFIVKVATILIAVPIISIFRTKTRINSQN
ncbi:queuosine precursor transporter [Candidatus Dependentiae bacterium]